MSTMSFTFTDGPVWAKAEVDKAAKIQIEVINFFIHPPDDVILFEVRRRNYAAPLSSPSNEFELATPFVTRLVQNSFREFKSKIARSASLLSRGAAAELNHGRRPWFKIPDRKSGSS